MIMSFSTTDLKRNVSNSTMGLGKKTPGFTYNNSNINLRLKWKKSVDMNIKKIWINMKKRALNNWAIKVMWSNWSRTPVRLTIADGRISSGIWCIASWVAYALCCPVRFDCFQSCELRTWTMDPFSWHHVRRNIRWVHICRICNRIPNYPSTIFVVVRLVCERLRPYSW